MPLLFSYDINIFYHYSSQLLQLYDEKEMLKGKLDLLSNTNMVDFAMDVHKTLYPDQEVPSGKTE